MSIKTSLVAGVASAFAAIGDVKKSVRLRVTTNSGYDTATGTFASANTDYTFDAVHLSIRRGDLDQGAPSGQSKLLFEQRTCPVIPTMDDQIIIGDRWYEVTRVDTDPANVTWTLFIREAGYERN